MKTYNTKDLVQLLHTVLRAKGLVLNENNNEITNLNGRLMGYYGGGLKYENNVFEYIFKPLTGINYINIEFTIGGLNEYP